MKRITLALVLVLAMLMSLGLTVSAADTTLTQAGISYEGVAEELYSVGILVGDGVNFNLGDIPDRLQSAVMTVRMLGKEAEALAQYDAGEISCIFTDVTEQQNWAKPYLAWLYENKITLGIGDNKFGNGVCTAQMYCTFMLRALGYSVLSQVEEGSDAILFDRALDAALEKNLYDGMLAQGEFHRGAMAAVTYQTLAAPVKDGSQLLLDKLVAEGAIAAEPAQPIQAKIAEINRLSDLLAGIAQPEMKTMTGTFNVGMEMNTRYGDGTTEKVATTGKFDITEVYTGETPQAAYVGTLDMAITGEESLTLSMPYKMWLKDQTLYMELSDSKTKMPLSEGDAMITAGMETNKSTFTLMPYYAYDNVTVEESADGVTFSYDASSYLEPVAEMLLGDQVQEGDAKATYTVSGKVVITKDGKANVYANTYERSAQYYEGETLLGSDTRTLTYETKVVTVNQDITISYPDLTAFVDA